MRTPAIVWRRSVGMFSLFAVAGGALLLANMGAPLPTRTADVGERTPFLEELMPPRILAALLAAALKVAWASTIQPTGNPRPVRCCCDQFRSCVWRGVDAVFGAGECFRLATFPAGSARRGGDTADYYDSYWAVSPHRMLVGGDGALHRVTMLLPMLSV